MMDIETIIAVNKQAGNKAKRHGMKPTTFGPEDIEGMSEGFTGVISGIVDFGNYVPKGWRRFDINLFSKQWDLPYSWKFLKKGGLFVDSSGFGADGEPALTIKQFLHVMVDILKNRSDLGFALISQGQFQVTIGVFEKCSN